MITDTAFRRMKRRVRNRSAECERATLLSKYYTRPEIAQECTMLFEDFIGPETLIIEPSAGAGAFLEAAHRPILGYDVAPDHPYVTERDFIIDGLSPALADLDDIALLGNPPFGRRSTLALEFVNRGLHQAGTVGFILPSSFQRWDTQRKVDQRARLVFNHPLPEEAFSFIGRPFSLRSTFQVWTLNPDARDLRLRVAPLREHPDFAILQHSPGSTESLRHFDAAWDFAVRFQGTCSYGRVYDPAQCDPRHHWMMFKAKNEAALRRLLSIDFPALSRSRSIIPGFARADVVACYEAMAFKAK